VSAAGSGWGRGRGRGRGSGAGARVGGAGPVRCAPPSVPRPPKPLASWAGVSGSWVPGSPWTALHGHSGMLRDWQRHRYPTRSSPGPARVSGPGFLQLSAHSLGLRTGAYWGDLSSLLCASSPSARTNDCPEMLGSIGKLSSLGFAPHPPNTKRTIEGWGESSKAPQVSAVDRASSRCICPPQATHLGETVWSTPL
jgi:hypothetical protein